MNQTHNRLIFKICSQCAPVLLKVKPAATLTLTNEESRELVYTMDGIDVTCFPLINYGDCTTWFIYREEMLNQTLCKADAAFILTNLGYQIENLPECLLLLSHRFTRYKKSKQSFPHELGLFLDYPAEDVIGFVMNKGRDCRYCGYWKVYSDVRRARQTFYRYDLAKHTLLREVNNGKTFRQAIHALVC